MNELIEAIKANDVEKVKQLIEAGVDVNARDIYGFTDFLTDAVTQGNIEIAKLLIEAGADVNSSCFDHHLLSRTWDIEMAKILIENGANINAQDFTGFTALHRASHLGKVEMVKFLIESGANLNIWDRDCKSSLDLALRQKHLNSEHKEIAKLLIEAGAGQKILIENGIKYIYSVKNGDLKKIIT